jgi:hypothetical protein
LDFPQRKLGGSPAARRIPYKPHFVKIPPIEIPRRGSEKRAPSRIQAHATDARGRSGNYYLQRIETFLMDEFRNWLMTSGEVEIIKILMKGSPAAVA